MSAIYVTLRFSGHNKEIQFERNLFCSSVTSGGVGGGHSDLDTEDEAAAAAAAAMEGPFAFRRRRNCQYLRPLDRDEMERGFQGIVNNLERVGLEPRANPKSRFVHGSISTPVNRYLGLIRRYTATSIPINVQSY